MRISVCEAPAVMNPGGEEWRALVEGTRIQNPDIVLLNEMPFGAWAFPLPLLASQIGMRT